MQKTLISKKRKSLGIYILARNEEDNIEACIVSLSKLEQPIFLLDSGSSDNTIEIARKYSKVRIQQFIYNNHCESYNSITNHLALDFDYCIVIDADMRLDDTLIQQVQFILEGDFPRSTAYLSKVDMYIDSSKLRFCSLYPPKPFMFSTGASYFVPVGHGEQLIFTIRKNLLTGRIRHDDRKPYSRFISSQISYAVSLCNRFKQGFYNWRDFVRLRSPIFIIVAPLYIYIFRLGFLDGMAGFKYAVDRMVAEAIMFRVGITQGPKDKDIQE